MKLTAVNCLIKELKNEILKHSNSDNDLNDYCLGLKKALDLCVITELIESEQLIEAVNYGISISDLDIDSKTKVYNYFKKTFKNNEQQ
jgi:hypothetical protein